MENKVALIKCQEYNFDKVYNAIKQGVDAFGGISNFVKPKQKVVLKINLVIKFAPERAATTHPVVVAALSKLCAEAGAEVVVIDSAGGPFNANYMGAIYNTGGITQASIDYGFKISDNYNSAEVIYNEAKVAKTFEILEELKTADVIINVCKLKSHSFTGITNAVKNMFGAIPGLKKV